MSHLYFIILFVVLADCRLSPRNAFTTYPRNEDFLCLPSRWNGCQYFILVISQAYGRILKYATSPAGIRQRCSCCHLPPNFPFQPPLLTETKYTPLCEWLRTTLENYTVPFLIYPTFARLNKLDNTKMYNYGECVLLNVIKVCNNFHFVRTTKIIESTYSLLLIDNENIVQNDYITGLQYLSPIYYKLSQVKQ